MWKEFISGYRRPREGEVLNTAYPEKTYINLTAVIAVGNGYTEIWDAVREEHIEVSSLSLIFGNKSIQIIEVEYEAMIALLKNIPKNSPFHKGAV